MTEAEYRKLQKERYENSKGTKRPHILVGKSGTKVHYAASYTGNALCGAGVNTIGTRFSSSVRETTNPVTCTRCIELATKEETGDTQ